MEKTVGAFEARRQFGTLLEEVHGRGDRVIVERHGKPVAVVIPVEAYEQWKRACERFFQTLEDAANRSNLDSEAAMELANEAVQAVRSREQ